NPGREHERLARGWYCGQDARPPFLQQGCCDGAMADGQSRKGARASRSRVMRAGCPPSLTALRDMGGGRLARDIAVAPKSNLEAGCREITSPTGAPLCLTKKFSFTTTVSTASTRAYPSGSGMPSRVFRGGPSR